MAQRTSRHIKSKTPQEIHELNEEREEEKKGKENCKFSRVKSAFQYPNYLRAAALLGGVAGRDPCAPAANMRFFSAGFRICIPRRK
jgi:hypothetical protein